MSTPHPSKKPPSIPNPRRLLILSPPSHSLTTIPPSPALSNRHPGHRPPPQPTPPSPPSPATRPTRPSPSPQNTTPPTSPSGSTRSPLAPHAQDSPSAQWRTEFLSPEAEIVRDALGALVVCVRNPAGTRAGQAVDERADVRELRALMRDIGAVKERVDEERGGVGDVPGIFVLVGPGVGGLGAETEGGEEGLGGYRGRRGLCRGVGGRISSLIWGLLGGRLWSGILQWRGEGKRNAFGEYEGMPRIKEVLETHEWASADVDGGADLDAEFGFESDLEGEVVGSREMLGLRMAIEHGGEGDEEFDDGDEDLKVESMEGLMMRMQALRDMGSDLPEAERKKFAAKAVQDIMREL
ncbi:Alpha/gamma-adaptin-binding protein p34 [Penicillium chermesinum]|nr:Alpha/gamma-adaptin-binding protein p34 [Penicillium chermesinum]